MSAASLLLLWPAAEAPLALRTLLLLGTGCPLDVLVLNAAGCASLLLRSPAATVRDLVAGVRSGPPLDALLTLPPPFPPAEVCTFVLLANVTPPFAVAVEELAWLVLPLHRDDAPDSSLWVELRVPPDTFCCSCCCWD